MRQAETFPKMLLFAMPNFIKGFSRVLDLGGTLDVYNTDESELVADQKALTSDWKQVGADIQEAIERQQNV